LKKQKITCLVFVGYEIHMNMKKNSHKLYESEKKVRYFMSRYCEKLTRAIKSIVAA